MIRRFGLAALLAVVAFGFGFSGVRADDRNFTLVNASTATMNHIYVSLSTANDWGYDLLGETGILEAGMQVDIVFRNPSTNCIYDIKTDFADKTNYEFLGIDLCVTMKVVATDTEITAE